NKNKSTTEESNESTSKTASASGQASGSNSSGNTSSSGESSNSSQNSSSTATTSGECNIKGSESGIYHVPGSTYYERTKNVVQWFCSTDEAENAGYRAPKR